MDYSWRWLIICDKTKDQICSIFVCAVSRTTLLSLAFSETLIDRGVIQFFRISEGFTDDQLNVLAISLRSHGFRPHLCFAIYEMPLTIYYHWLTHLCFAIYEMPLTIYYHRLPEALDSAVMGSALKIAHRMPLL